MILAALLASLMAATSLLSLSIGPVPISLQMLFVALIALVLSPGTAMASVSLYVALGAIGLPVFAGGKAGLGVLIGPTGGYLIGFIVAAGVGSWVARLHQQTSVQIDIVAVSAVFLVTYSIGTVWLGYVLHMQPWAAIVAGVIPFVLPDLIKAGVAVVLAYYLRRAVQVGTH